MLIIVYHLLGNIYLTLKINFNCVKKFGFPVNLKVLSFSDYWYKSTILCSVTWHLHIILFVLTSVK